MKIRRSLFAKRLRDRLGIKVMTLRRLPRVTESRVFRHYSSITEESCRVILDVGANIGETAMSYAREFPQAQIHAFEPVSATFALLRGNTAEQGRVHPHHMALSGQNGTLEIQLDSRTASKTNSLSEYNQNFVVSRGGQRELVTLKTGDLFCDEFGVDRIDILKTDTEGHDLEVLHGFPGRLAGGRIRSVVCEVGFAGDPAHTPFDKVHALLIPHGFRLAGFYECQYEPPATHGFANALFVHGDSFVRPETWGIPRL